jgi:hypothetical protein
MFPVERGFEISAMRVREFIAAPASSRIGKRSPASVEPRMRLDWLAFST